MLHHLVYHLFQLPFPVIRTVAISRRIEDNTVVFFPPFHLAFHECHRIFHHPANIFQSAQFHVLICPCNDLPHGIKMYHISPCCLCSKRSSAGVSKEIEESRPFFSPLLWTCPDSFGRGAGGEAFEAIINIIPIHR